MKPRWLLNENVPMPAARQLRESGWDVVHIGEQNEGISDEAVLKMCCQQRRALVTFDRDYGELLFRRRLEAPALVLLLRVESYSPTEPALWIESLYAQGELRVDYFHIFDGLTVRRRPLPHPRLSLT